MPRPKKTLPVRTVCMLMLCNDAGEVLLEQRPAAGIWGGLWSFPELPDVEAASGYCRDELGVSIESMTAWPQLRHTFSHFHLDITPVLVAAGTGDSVIMEADDRLWYNTDSQAERGFASPVNRLLQQLEQWRTES